ncbi:MAG: D-glycero-beta-D-manno-heptose-7-phosphate kinase [Acidobacteriia bacterium]|nr:D-glycero-beta-D-manno-heptose-7-phosphate kinase [Terriglobia bacterium]
MLDEFLWGKVSRISPEAPVPVVDVTAESYYPGGAANVARNVREFTPRVAVMGLAGRDSAGERLVELLERAQIDTSAVLRDPAYSTTVKTRIIARHQQVVRVDRERKAPLPAGQAETAVRLLDRAIAEMDAIVVADYGKGFLTQAFADHICRAARAHGKILTVDPHPHTSLRWRGATVVKPNRAEAFLAAALPPTDPVEPVLSDAALLGAGKRLLETWEAGSVLITLGEQGMLLLRSGSPPHHTPARAQEVFDVSGAGDTAIAVLTLALAAGATPAEAAEMANCAGGIVVGKVGTATVTAAELRAACGAV